MTRDDLPSLLLLPFPPSPSTRLALNAAYRPSLAAAASKLRRVDSSSRLVVVLPCPILVGSNPRTKTLAWTEAQALVAGIYAILAVICTELSLATDVNAGPGSLDATVLLVDHDRKRQLPNDAGRDPEPNGTVVLNLPVFASTYYPWNFIFYVASEAGLQVRQSFLNYAEARQTLLQDQLIAVDGGLTMHVNPPATGPSVVSGQAGYPTVCLGGTFDHLHPGHKLLLSAAAFLLRVPEPGSAPACEFIIGITGDELLKKKKFAEYVQSWSERATNVVRFLATLLEMAPEALQAERQPTILSETDTQIHASFRQGTIKVQCVLIHDAFGPTITRKDIGALVVSAETSSGGEAVNQKRTERDWPALQLFQVDVLDAADLSGEATASAADFSSKLSSTSIRERISRTRESAAEGEPQQ